MSSPPRRLSQEAREALGWADRGDEEGPDAPVTEGLRPYLVRCRAMAMDWTFTVHANNVEQACELARKRSRTDDVEIIRIGDIVLDQWADQFQHVIELHITTVGANPDMPSININTLAERLRDEISARLTNECFLYVEVQASARRVS